MSRPNFIFRAIIVPVVCILGISILVRSTDLRLAKTMGFLLAIVLFADIATLTRRWMQNAMIVLASLALGLAILEAYVDLQGPHVVVGKMPRFFRVSDPHLGVSPSGGGIARAEKTVDGKTAYAVTYTIDEGRRRLTRSASNGPRIRFFGDSYTFGEGLNDSETLPQVFADLTRAHVLNFGYPGYSPAQALRALELGLYDRDLIGSRLFILQTGDFHVERVACLPDWTEGAPRYLAQAGQVRIGGTCAPMAGQSFGLSRLFRGQIRKVRAEDVRTYIAVVDAFVRLARAKYHVPVLVLDMTNDEWGLLRGTGFDSKELDKQFSAAGALVLDGTLDARPGDVLTIPLDGHPTATANRLMAQKIIKFVETVHPDALAPSPPIAALPGDMN